MSEDLTGRGKEIGGVELPLYTEEGKLFNIVNNVPQALKPFNLLCQVYSETTLYIKASPMLFVFINGSPDVYISRRNLISLHRF